jgi:hypothetical protein
VKEVRRGLGAYIVNLRIHRIRNRAVNPSFGVVGIDCRRE